jgi:hypothetical protein
VQIAQARLAEAEDRRRTAESVRRLQPAPTAA